MNKELTRKELTMDELEQVNGGEVISMGLIALLGVCVAGMTGCAVYENTKD